eukprot:7387190-Prymnesium_polylepis.1
MPCSDPRETFPAQAPEPRRERSTRNPARSCATVPDRNPLPPSPATSPPRSQLVRACRSSPLTNGACASLSWM